MKSERVQLVVTERDRRAWTSAARRAGLSLNEFVRQQVNGALDAPAHGSVRGARAALRRALTVLLDAERALGPATRKTARRRGASR